MSAMLAPTHPVARFFYLIWITIAYVSEYCYLRISAFVNLQYRRAANQVAGLMLHRFVGTPLGAVDFNCDVDNSDGQLIVRSTAEQGGLMTISFRCENRFAFDRDVFTGEEVVRLLSQAMLEGYRPCWLVLDGRKVRMPAFAL